MKIGKYETHRFADAFPMLEGEQWAAFVDGIKRGGFVSNKVWLFEGKILDGRNRYKAALELGLEAKLKFVNFDGSELEAHEFVKAMNWDRRNMGASVRVLVACRLLEVRPKQRRKSGTSSGTESTAAERAAIAKQFDVSERYLRFGQEVLAEAAPEVIAAIDAEDLTISEALEIVKQPHEEQRAALERRAAAATTRGRSTALRGQAKNDEQLSEKAAGQQLCRTVVRSIEQLGATVQKLAGGIDTKHAELTIAYAGHVFTLALHAKRDASEHAA